MAFLNYCTSASEGYIAMFLFSPLKGVKGDIGEKGDFGQIGFMGQKGPKGFKGKFVHCKFTQQNANKQDL